MAIALTLVLGAVCCRSASPARGTDETAVREALAGFVEAFNNLDWETFRNCFAADATLFNPEIPEAPKLERIDGRLALEESFRTVFATARQQAAGPPYLHIVARKVKVQMLAGAAVATFEFDRDGGSIGRRTVVFRREPDRWRIIHIHASNVSRRDGG